MRAFHKFSPREDSWSWRTTILAIALLLPVLTVMAGTAVRPTPPAPPAVYSNGASTFAEVVGTSPAAAVQSARRSTLDYTDRYVPSPYSTIQAAIDVSDPGDIIHVAAGAYYENIVVDVSVTIDGADQTLTIIYPASTDPGLPDPEAGPSFRGSQVIVIQAHDVVISNLTVDGNNPTLSSGVARGGVDIDARNGIIEGDGPWNGLTVHDVTVQNIYLRGIYMRSGGNGWHIHHNTVDNVAGGSNTIAIMNWNGTGVIEYNTLTNCLDAIGANHSRGATYQYNTVTNCGSGVHSDNNGNTGMGGGVPDTIRYNNVSNSSANGYGVWVFFPYVNTVLNNNTMTNVDVGLFAWGGSGGIGQFVNNTVDGQNRSGSIGVYVTPGPDYWSSWQDNVNTSFSGNSVSNCVWGFAVETDANTPFYSLTVTVSSLTLSGNTTDIYEVGNGPMTITGLSGNTVYADYPGSIQRGINLCNSGGAVTVAAGTFQENVTVNKKLTVDGAGSGAGGTVITPPSGIGIVITASGASVSDRLVLKDLRVTGASTNGIDIDAANASFLTFENVACVANGGHGINTNPATGSGSFVDLRLTDCDLSSNASTGFRVASYVGINGLTVTNGHMDGNVYGMQFYHSVGSPIVTNVSITGTTFNNNSSKGMYLEKLSDATFTNVTVNNSGTSGAWAAGVDINLKYSNYQNIVFNNPVVTGCGTGDAVNGAGITVKARDDGSYASNPAMLTNVQINNAIISGCQEAIRFGEPTRNNAGPTGAIVYSSSVTGSTLKHIRNETQSVVNASGNWWGSSDPATVASEVSSNADYTPWLDNGNDMSGDPGFQGDFRTLWVDDNSPQTGSVGRVQEGVNMVTGSTIYLGPGTYVGQVTVSSFPSALSIIGTGPTRADVTMKAVASMTPFAGNRRAVLAIVNTPTVNVSNLTIDGDGQGNTNERLMGVAFWNSGGSLTNVCVTKVRETPLSGNDTGVGVYAYNTGGGPYTINVTDVQVDDYQKNAFALNSNNNLTCHLLRVTTIGAGPLGSGYPAQNGIQFGWGTSGTITDCNVSGNFYAASGWAATGILLYLAGNTTVSGGTLSDNQTGLDFGNTSGSASGITVNGPSTRGFWVEGVMAENYNGYTLSMGKPRPQPVDAESHSGEEQGGGSLDANQTVSFSGLTCTGQDRDSSIALYFWANFDQITGTVSNCDLINWEQGIAVEEADAGQLSVAMTGSDLLSNTEYGLWNNSGSMNASGNKFDNPGGSVYNCWDPQSGNSYNSNCWSDFASNSGFPTQYNIPGLGGNADFNPSSDCSNIDMVMSSDYVGCPAACEQDTLFLRFDQVGYYSAQVIIQLPAGMVADWSGVNPNVMPDSSIRTANLYSAWANAVGTTIEVDVLWGPHPDRSVDDGKYFAAVPLRGTSTTHGAVLQPTITSYNFVNAGGEHTTGFTITPAASVVDCQGPVTSLSGGGGEPPSCDAYNSATDFVNALTYDVQAGAAPNSPLDHAYIVVNATQFALTSYSGSWPSSGQAAAVWAAMAEGCNTFVLHAFDTECNENTATVTGVIKDITPPTVGANPMNQPLCYNNEPTSPQYGASLIATDLNINATVGSGSCIASTGTLQLGYGASVYPTTPVALPVTTWPDGGDAAALWTWMVSVLPSEFSGTATFGIIVRDCAGNELTPHPTFNVCIDLHKPDNTFTIFDARPTYLGVWLKWQWTYDAVQSDSAEVWRKGEGEYPIYPHNYSLDLANYERNHTQLFAHGWTRVLIQAGASGTTSAAWDANPLHHHIDPTLGNYWKDEIGSDAVQLRDIYRYVTFVRDAAGNWSQVGSYVLLTNADRSTNYWLGDYSGDVGNPEPRGIVNGPDLAYLSAGYFQAVPPAANYLDIGPENHENAYGKGIPNPDQMINFYDLLPFSFNFGMVGSGGFLLAPPPTRPFSTLDEVPVVSLTRVGDDPLNAGDVFTVTITLSGNAANVVKAAEAVLAFDAEVLEVVSAVSGDIEVQDGLPFTAARLVEGRDGEVGVCAAAIGPAAYLAGDFTLGTVQLRWTNERAASTSLRIASYELADGAGNVLSGEGQVLAIGTASSVPTRFALYPNYPNPFNPATQIAFDLASEVNVQLVIYNLMGQQVRTLVHQPMAAGAYRVTWNGLDDHNRPAGSGLYLYRLVAGNFTDTRKMILTR